MANTAADILVEVWAIRKEHQLTLLAVNHTLPGRSISTEQVENTIPNSPEPTHSYIQRIDEDHANPRRTWMEIGSPEYLSALDIEQLQASSRLLKEPQPWSQVKDNICFHFDLPPHGLAAITFEFESLASQK